MPCPLVRAYLSRLLADLDGSTVNQDLFDEVSTLWEDVRSTATQTSSREAFCCEVAMRFIAVVAQGEPLPKTFNTRVLPMQPEFFRWQAALAPILAHYGVEVAEARMTADERGVEQLQQFVDARQLQQITRTLKLLEAAAEPNAARVGDLFYVFLKAAALPGEELVAMAYTLLEVRAP